MQKILNEDNLVWVIMLSAGSSRKCCFFSVGLGLLAKFFYVHDLWSLFHFSFYALLTAITINENGGLKCLISALDNWVAETITYRNRALIIERTTEPIDTPKANFTDTKIDMSQGDAIIINDDDNDEIEDELLPPPEYMLNGIFPCLRLVSSSATAAIIYHCFVRIPLLPSSTLLCTEYLCCHHLTLLRVTFSAANAFPTAVIVFFCHRLLVTSVTIASHFCYHLPLLRVTFYAAIIYHCIM
ncbi:hypothetical protein CEXT_163791 [Caerostris extrusa]|uniref:Uncharacterized protein n=1 Tax=Caerostris extrusa TaxID=172846 RepID=A0AAV4XRM4_CAEEX|nr:hypothetical protein CEXT_163791 [Caerostris extrusa]